MRTHESGIDRSPDTPGTFGTPTMPSSSLTPSSCAPTATTTISAFDTDTTDFSCPHCPCIFTPRIDLVGPMRICRRKTGEPVPEAPAYTCRIRLHCPHCYRTFMHRLGLFGHMLIHENLR
ncbi:hypothetical protein SprV_0200806900 [Sparganum proliferum]